MIFTLLAPGAAFLYFHSGTHARTRADACMHALARAEKSYSTNVFFAHVYVHTLGVINFSVVLANRVRPGAICWTPSSKLLVPGHLPVQQITG